MKIDDEKLVAYADGELDPGEAAQVKQAIATDQALQDRLSALTQAAGLTRSLFDAKAREPVPEALVEGILTANIGSAPHPMDERTGWWERVIASWQIPLPATAFAAVSLIAVGALVGQLLPQGNQSVDAIVTAGAIPAGSSLEGLLSTQPSGGLVTSGDLQIEAVATFLTDQRVCREYRAMSEAPQQQKYHAGIACLRDDGNWHVTFSVEEYLEYEPADGFYETASDKLHEAIDAFIDQGLGVDPLEDNAEQVLMSQGWKIKE